MIAVKLGEYNLFLGLGAALALAALVGLMEGAIVAKLRVHSMPVTLGFYIALLGANIAIGNSQSVSFSNLDVGSALDAVKFYILSWRSIIAFIVFALVFASCASPISGETSAPSEETGAQAAWWASRWTGC